MAKRTKKQAAQELMRLARKGPATGWAFAHELTPAARKAAERYASESYRIWSQAWLIPLIEELLPDSKDAA